MQILWVRKINKTQTKINKHKPNEQTINKQQCTKINNEHKNNKYKHIRKSYSSENQFAQHLKSRKHLEKNQSIHSSEVHKKIPNKLQSTPETETNTAATQTNTNKQTQTQQTQSALADEQKTEEQEIEEKIQNAKFFDPEECIFCDEKSKTMEE